MQEAASNQLTLHHSSSHHTAFLSIIAYVYTDTLLVWDTSAGAAASLVITHAQSHTLLHRQARLWIRSSTPRRRNWYVRSQEPTGLLILITLPADLHAALRR
jgi:hypothetical protein